MTHPDFAKAAAHISADAVRTLLMDLVDISSPTGREIGVAQYLVARMKKSGCRPSVICFAFHERRVEDVRSSSLSTRSLPSVFKSGVRLPFGAS